MSFSVSLTDGGSLFADINSQGYARLRVFVSDHGNPIPHAEIILDPAVKTYTLAAGLHKNTTLI